MQWHIILSKAFYEKIITDLDLVNNDKKDVKKGKFKTLKQELSSNNYRLNTLSQNINIFDFDKIYDK